MKKVLILICLLLCSIYGAKAQMSGSMIEQTMNSVHPGMKYSEYKNLYDTAFYLPEAGDLYSPAWAGILSFLVPGLGQGLDDEWGRAALFYLGNMTCVTVAMSQAGRDFYITSDPDKIYDTYKNPGNQWILLGALVCAAGIDIWSIIDAVKVAKVKNMYYQDLRDRQKSVSVSLSPFLIDATADTQNNTQMAAGLSLRLLF